MASPVDTSVKHFHHEMEAAPVLAGQAGSLIALLDACLVTGFGLKAVTSLTVAGGVATLAFADSHGALVESVVLVEGVTGALAGLNGEQRVTSLGASQVKFATALPDGTAAGTITFKMAPAGWAKVFSGTNAAVYRSPLPEATRMYLRVSDNSTLSARIWGYETMTSVSAGSGIFPSSEQISGGGHLIKSSVANSSPVKWTVVANGRTAYVSTVPYSTNGPAFEAGRTVLLGDFEAFRTGGDPYAFGVGCATSNSESESTGVLDGPKDAGTYAPRGYTGLGGSVGHRVMAEIGTFGEWSGIDGMLGQFPSVVDGGLRLSRRFVCSASEGTPRGVVPGFYSVPQSGVCMFFAPRQVQPGAGPLLGRKLLAVGCGLFYAQAPSAYFGISFIDITGPWKY